MLIFAITVSFLLFSTRSTMAQDPSCDYQDTVRPGVTHYVYNREYPGNYMKGTQCRWIAYALRGYRLRLNCSVFLPQTQNCNQDRLLISKTGDPYLSNAERYCGTGTLNILSKSTSLSIGLIAAPNSPGGRLNCTLRAEAASTPSPICSCGYKKTNRIVGGIETGVNEYPSMAGLVDADERVIYCGAVIATKQAVITAAHCVKGRTTNKVGVIVGEHNVNEADSPVTKGYRVESFLIHPQYSSNTNDNDIALVFTADVIEFSDRVGPICLPFKFANEDFTNKTVTALGWGTIFIGGPTSPYLQKVNLTVVSNQVCSKSSPLFLSKRQVCTYAAGKDACQNDSGGPLVFSDPKSRLDYHVGIISVGRSCASGSPAVNTRITQFLDWLKDNTPPHELCEK